MKNRNLIIGLLLLLVMSVSVLVIGLGNSNVTKTPKIEKELVKVDEQSDVVEVDVRLVTFAIFENLEKRISEFEGGSEPSQETLDEITYYTWQQNGGTIFLTGRQDHNGTEKYSVFGLSTRLDALYKARGFESPFGGVGGTGVITLDKELSKPSNFDEYMAQMKKRAVELRSSN